MQHKIFDQPLLLIPISLLLLLVGMGVAYGMWTDTLTISGNISTGSVRGEWDETSGYPSGCICSNIYSLPIASTTCQRDSADHTRLNFSIQNGYPGYTVSCSVSFHYTGTIPATIQSETIKATSPFIYQLDTGPIPGNGELWVHLKNGLGTIIDPSTGLNLTKDGTLGVQVGPNAKPNTPYQFSVEILLAQYTH